MSRLEKQPQDMQTTLQSPLENKVAAFQPILTQTPEIEQLANLQQQEGQLSTMLSGTRPLKHINLHQEILTITTVEPMRKFTV